MNKNATKLLATAMVFGLIAGGSAMAHEGKHPNKKAAAGKKAGDGCNSGDGCHGKEKNSSKTSEAKKAKEGEKAPEGDENKPE